MQASLELLIKRDVKYHATHSILKIFLFSEDGVGPTLLENFQTSRLAEVSDFLFCKVSTAQIIEPPAHVTQPWLYSTMDICETLTWSSQPRDIFEEASIKDHCVQIYIWQLVSD